MTPTTQTLDRARLARLMAQLMSPATSETDVDRHTEAFDAAVVALFA